MAESVSMALAELVREAERQGDVDFLREGVRVLSQALMEVDVRQHPGAERHERSGVRGTCTGRLSSKGDCLVRRAAPRVNP